MTAARSTTVALVGAGPIGIEAAAALRHAGITYRHFEAGCVGSTMSWWAPGTVFFSSSDRISIAGVPLHTTQQTKASREEYLCYLRSVIEQFDLEIETYTRVTRIKQTDGGWRLSLQPSRHGVGGPAEQKRQTHPAAASTETVSVDKLILAIGDMHRPNLLGIPGEELPHVSHYFDEPHRFFRKRVLIVGGKNSAVEAAIRLVRIGAAVSIAYRGAEFDKNRIKFWLLPELKSLIKRGALQFLPNTRPQAILESEVQLVDANGMVSTQPADFVLLLTGYKQDSSLFEQAGVALEGEGRRPVFNPQTMETNARGLYVIGTATAGTQLGGVTEFIETSHVHIGRVLAHLQGAPPPAENALRDVSQREL